MIGLLQRVKQAAVEVAGERIAEIGSGLLVFIGVERTDVAADAARLAQRLVNWRVFPDAGGRMNLSLADTGGGLLLVPQFTLVASTERGNRPGFDRAAAPEHGLAMFQQLVASARERHALVRTGHFGADMAVQLVNDGPVTFILQVPPARARPA